MTLCLHFHQTDIVRLINKCWSYPAVWSVERECVSTKKPMQEPRAQAWFHLACQPTFYHRQMGIKHSRTSWKRCFLVRKGAQDKGWSSLMSAPGAGWQSCAIGLKTHTCLPPPGFIQAPQMYKFHIAHAGGLMSTKEFTLIFWLLLMHRVHLLFSSPDNCAMGIGLEYV